MKKAVEGGFEFNSIDNGMALDKYSSKTGLGRHGPHPYYTNQIRNHLEWWQNQKSIINGEEIVNSNLSIQRTAEYIQGLVDDIKISINSTSGRINELNLDLPI